MKPCDLTAIASKLPLSKSTIARNAVLSETEQEKQCLAILAPRLQKKRLRQSSKPLLNKLETEFYNRISANGANFLIRCQAKRYRLGNGIWFKPDLTCSCWNGNETAWEVKGPHAFRGGFENLKVAASTYPEVRWILVWKESGQWKEQTVLP